MAGHPSVALGIGTYLFHDVLASFLPTAPTDVYVGDCRLHQMVIFNNGGGSPVVHVFDKQARPVPILPESPLSANGGSTSLTATEGRLCPGGFSWWASDPNVIGYAIYSVDGAA